MGLDMFSDALISRAMMLIETSRRLLLLAYCLGRRRRTRNAQRLLHATLAFVGLVLRKRCAVAIIFTEFLLPMNTLQRAII